MLKIIVLLLLTKDLNLHGITSSYRLRDETTVPSILYYNQLKVERNKNTMRELKAWGIN